MAKSKGTNDKVGYKRPPLHTQFQPGQSGNPKGRPKKVPTLIDEVESELRSLITIPQGKRTLKITKLRAIIKQHVIKAINGDPRSTALILALTRQQPPDERKNGLQLLLQEFREKNARYVAADPNRTPPHNGPPKSDE